jgi:hypothetical protein
MSRGPGQIEQRIGELFAATRDRALSIADICDHAFALDGAPPTRVQRLSATRATHRLLRRVRDADTKSDNLVRDEFPDDVPADEVPCTVVERRISR